MPHKQYKRYNSTGLFPQSLGALLHRVTQPATAKKGSAYVKLLANWEEIAGLEIAKKCTPLTLTFPRQKYNEGKLTLSTTSAMAIEIQHLTPLLIEKIAIYFGYRVVERISIVQASTSPTDATIPAPNKQPTVTPQESMLTLNELPASLQDALGKLQKTMCTLD